jgi:hypothetical protein
VTGLISKVRLAFHHTPPPFTLTCPTVGVRGGESKIKGEDMEYERFIEGKTHYGSMSGFEPVSIPDYLFDFQKYLVDWAVRKGRCAIFADCGLGKTPMQLVWADNITQFTNKNVLIVTPLAVGYQTAQEARKFGIEATQSRDGKLFKGITITNYEQLHKFSPVDFIGIVCDESGILKNYDGVTRGLVTEFSKKIPYRLLCTATPSPNDYIELGTSSEALGELGFMDMLTRFFKNQNNSIDTKRHWAQTGGAPQQWRFKKHAESSFWRWVSSWSRAIRKPSDLGYDDGMFILPELIERQTEIKSQVPIPGMLFAQEVRGLYEQKQELKSTVVERCEAVADIVNQNGCSLVWCQFNEEGDLLEKLIPGSKQVAGKHSDEEKESRLKAFSQGDIKVLITKSKIAGFGLNWQHCSHMTYFPSYSFEQYYQGIRRCWRFGQTKPVTVDIVTTTGMKTVLDNMQRKARASEKMFAELTAYMNDAIKLERQTFEKKVEVPAWL